MDEELEKYKLRIIFQRIKCFKEKYYSKGENLAFEDIEQQQQRQRERECQETIEIKRGVRLNNLKIREFLSEQNSISCQIIENYNSFDSDEKFKQMCKKAMEICIHYERIFMFLEKFSKIVSEISPFFTVISGIFNFSITINLAVSIFCFIVILLNILGDWERLREKYAHLYGNFKILYSSNSETRLCDFSRNVDIFNSPNLSIDSLD